MKKLITIPFLLLFFCGYAQQDFNQKKSAITFTNKTGMVFTFYDSIVANELKEIASYQADETHYYLFVKDTSFNGYLYLYNTASNTFDRKTLFKHKPQWSRTFFGKPHNHLPILYHINEYNQYIYQSYFQNEQWRIHKTFPLNSDQLNAICQSQQLASSWENPNTYYINMTIEDDFYTFLETQNDQSPAARASNIPEELKGAKPTNAFTPIWCEGDDLSYANPKPTILYKEVPGSRIEIPNMPAYKTQDELGECRAFSLAVLIQKYTCDKWKNDCPDCAHPPADLDISYFGMMMYTNRDTAVNKTFLPNQDKARSMYDIITEISKDPSFILESCKPFYKLVNSFSSSGQAGIDKMESFFVYLKKLYADHKVNTEEEVVDCAAFLDEITSYTGIEQHYFNLKKALTKESYDKFLYVLFFDGCKREGFADGFRPYSYPDDQTNASSADIKNKIIEGLKKGKPILYPQVCWATDLENKCISVHSIVLSGYRKCCNKDKQCKELIKIHNSWGESWQKMNNDGWIDLEILLNNTYRSPNQNRNSKFLPTVVNWLEP